MRTAVAKPVRWTVKDYFRMAKARVFRGRRVELINGEVVEMAAQGHAHRVCISKITGLLVPAFMPANWVVFQGTLTLSRFNAPDPDFHVFDVPVATPDDQLPLPLLVIEVSDSTYRDDSGVKLRLYARSGMADYWIVNIPQDRVEVYRRPENPTGRRNGWRYADVTHYGRGQQVSPLQRPQVSFSVDAMLP